MKELLTAISKKDSTRISLRSNIETDRTREVLEDLKQHLKQNQVSHFLGWFFTFLLAQRTIMTILNNQKNESYHKISSKV